jgi:hypothetical protein
VLIDCSADSGAAETYAADEGKIAVSTQQEVMPLLWCSETKSIKVERRYTESKENKHLEESSSWDGFKFNL